ncbi:hypothetical protein ACVINW_003990 [Bradyrhizobium sp. USDA 4461]
MERNLTPPETATIESSDSDLDRRPEPPVMDLFSFTECANQTHSLRALFELLVSCATEEGFSEVAYGALNFVEPLRLAEYPPPTVAVKWPSDWCERYFKRKYHTIDPVVRRTPMLSRPFLWDQLADHYRLQPDERRVLDEAREAGLKHGMSVPLFGPLAEYLWCRLHLRRTTPILRIASVISMHWPGTFTPPMATSRVPATMAVRRKWHCRSGRSAACDGSRKENHRGKSG